MGQTNYQKTFLFTVILVLLTIVFVAYVQIRGQENIEDNASYLDPFLIDVLAFTAGIFLVIEGAYRILEHRDNSLSRQFTRSVRIAFGFGILTTHVIQALHKVYFLVLVVS